MSNFNAVDYKISSMENWDLVAPDYHRSWAGISKGPFKSTAELIEAADIRSDSQVLDLACGTGAVSAAVAPKLGPLGRIIGIDFSAGALAVAKTGPAHAELFQMDAENIGFRHQFDRILCQYAITFFPRASSVLSCLRYLMRPGGVLALAVHGTPEGVPYFNTIMAPTLDAIPDIRQPGAPTVHRYGRAEDLEQELKVSGYTGISIKKFTFDYQAGAFEEYWADYLATTAVSIRKKIESDPGTLASIKRTAKDRAESYTKDGQITFPWDVLVATANPDK